MLTGDKPRGGPYLQGIKPKEVRAYRGQNLRRSMLREQSLGRWLLLAEMPFLTRQLALSRIGILVLKRGTLKGSKSSIKFEVK